MVRHYQAKTYINEKEKNILRKISQKTKQSESKVLRNLITEAELIELPSADYAEVILQLRRIGNNLNQLTKLAHENFPVSQKEVENALIELNQTTQYLTSLTTRKRRIDSNGDK